MKTLYRRQSLLIVALCGILIYAYVTDRSSPGYQHGRFVLLLIETSVLVLLAFFIWSIVVYIRAVAGGDRIPAIEDLRISGYDLFENSGQGGMGQSIALRLGCCGAAIAIKPRPRNVL